MYRIEKPSLDSDSVDSLTMNKVLDLERIILKRNIFWKGFASIVLLLSLVVIFNIFQKGEELMTMVYKDSLRVNNTLLKLEKTLERTLSAEVKLHHLQREVYTYMKGANHQPGIRFNRLKDSFNFSIREDSRSVDDLGDHFTDTEF
tara:strand:+ start:547 stop:984 length:438 start_codon:yes stop_codon:yes gene_type:complete